MPLSFPSNPTTGQTSTQNGRSYTYAGGNVWELTPATGGSGEDTALRAYFLPPAPTSVTATGGNAQASLTWIAPTVLTQTPITDYVVQYSSNSGSTWTTFSDGTSTATSATVTGLTNGTAYTFRVAGVNGVGTGPYTAATSSVTPSTSVSIDLLMVAGGGSGGYLFGGGGGAGGLIQQQSLAISAGTYAVVVGAGGAWGAYDNFSGSDSTAFALTAIGGGKGGSYAVDSGNGGSGGGGGATFNDAHSYLGGSGTSGQGYSGGRSYWNSGAPQAGGGGGAGGAGANAVESSNGPAGNGGVGLQSSITGTATYYAGGGGGSSYYPSNPGMGGLGGGGPGGRGSTNTPNGNAGEGSTGGGGGGSEQRPQASNAGGSGVVIIRTLATASATTGSPTVTQDGAYNVYKFTGTGSITF